MSAQPRVRIGAVKYLNTRPLVYRIAESIPWAEVVYDLPSRLADALAAGQLDVALVPSIESVQDPGYTIVSDVCIGCRGPVLSVKLFSRTPIERIRSLALDEGSRTSAALAQILLSKRFGIAPRLELLKVGDSLSRTDADAILLIGDRAMHSPPGRFAAVWDLGDQWCRWTGLPFVFAMWTARCGAPLEGLEAALAATRDAGVAHLDEIATAEAATMGLTEPECRNYLRRHLNFYLGPGERQGLELFLRYAAELGLLPAGVDLGFSHCKTAG